MSTQRQDAKLLRLEFARSFELRLQPPGSPPPGPINLQVSDDDVIILSPTAFQQASSSRRAQRSTRVTDVESVEISARNQRRLLDLNREPHYVNFEGTSSSMVEPVALPPSPPPPPVPKFICPICMGELVEETSTKCGHLFCEGCIRTAISAQAKCPTCRRKVTHRDLIRIYFPPTN